MNIIDIYYLTNKGGEWLNQGIQFNEHDLQLDNWKYKIDKYILENKRQSILIERELKIEDPDISLTLDIIDIDCDVELWMKISNYIDKLLNY